MNSPTFPTLHPEANMTRIPDLTSLALRVEQAVTFAFTRYQGKWNSWCVVAGMPLVALGIGAGCVALWWPA